MSERNQVGKAPGDIPMGRSAQYTEQVDGQLLGASPSMLPFCSIITDYDDVTILGRKAAKKKKRIIRRNKKSSHKKLRRTLAVCVAAVLLAVTLTAGECFYILRDYQPAPVRLFPQTVPEEAAMTDVLLLFDFNDGKEAPEFDAHCLMLASLAPLSGSVSLTVFPQDCALRLPDGTKTTPGSLIYRGEYDLAAQTVCKNSGINPAGYIKITESDFTDFIDAIGGLHLSAPDIAVTEALREEGFSVPMDHSISADGKLAAAYCRVIKGQNEAFRSERQLETVSLALRKLRFANPVRLFLQARDAFGGIESDLPEAVLFRLALRLAFRPGNSVNTYTFPGLTDMPTTSDGLYLEKE